MAKVYSPKKYTEFWIHKGEESGDSLDFIYGKEWREAHKLVEECKQGKHPDIHSIERVVCIEDEGADEYETIYEREDQ